MNMTSRINRVFLVVLIFIVGCMGSYIATEQYVGVKYDDLIKQLGEPDNVNEFVYNYQDNLYEYQSNLYKILGDTQNVNIKELWWKKKDMVTIVWFKEFAGRWKSFDGMTYNGKYVTF